MSLYDDLGVKPDATPDEIKRAYKKLAKKHHPDRNGGSHEEMSRITAAYRILSDDDARARYDRTGETKKEPSVEDLARIKIFEGFNTALEREQMLTTTI